MPPGNKHFARMAAAFLIIALLQVYVLADATRPGAATTSAAESASVLYGKLDLPGSRLIYVNGNSVASGTTIFSGAQLQTPADTEATILLESVGQVYVAPDSKLTLTFDRTSVDVTVESGNAVLSTKEGVNGTVRSADGKVLSSSGSSTAGAVVGLPPAAASTSAAAAALSKEEKLAFIIIPVVIAAIIVAVAVNNDDDNDNVSPSAPQ